MVCRGGGGRDFKIVFLSSYFFFCFFFFLFPLSLFLFFVLFFFLFFWLCSWLDFGGGSWVVSYPTPLLSVTASAPLAHVQQ